MKFAKLMPGQHSSPAGRSLRFPALVLAQIGLVLLSACDGNADSGRPSDIIVTGENFYWSFQYAGADGLLGTSDDITGLRDLVLVRGEPYRLRITSTDYLYTFRIPALGYREIAVPGMQFPLEVELSEPGRYELEVDPMCGFDFLHENRIMGTLHVVEPEHFAASLHDAMARTASIRSRRSVEN